MNSLGNIVLPEKLPPPIVTCTIEGILEEDDLRELALDTKAEAPPGEYVPEPEEDPTDLKRLKERHHSVARLIVSGMPQGVVARLCQYDEAYLSVLLNSPAMQELVELYRIRAGAATEVIAEKLRTVGLEALDKISQKIKKDELNNQELIAASKLGLDRSGHGPSSTTHNVNEQHIIDHAEIMKRNKDAQTRNAPYIVPASDVRKALAPPKEQTGETSGELGPQADRLHEDRSELRPLDRSDGE